VVAKTMKLPSAYTRRAAVVRLSDAAFRLHLSALDWCSEQGIESVTRVGLAAIPHAPTGKRLDAVLDELELARLWKAEGVAWIVDVPKVEEERDLSAIRSEAGRRGGRKSAEVRRETYGTAQPRSKLEANADASPKQTDVGSEANDRSKADGASSQGPNLPSSLELSPLNQSSQALVLSGFSPDSSAPKSSDQGPDRLPARAANSRRSKPRTEAPDTLEPTPRHQQIASERGIDLAVETERCLAHHRGKGNLQANWNAVLTTWLLSPYAKAGVQQAASKVPGQNFALLNARIQRMEREEAEREAH
jgi:hypothetical protein